MVVKTAETNGWIITHKFLQHWNKCTNGCHLYIEW